MQNQISLFISNPAQSLKYDEKEQEAQFQELRTNLKYFRGKEEDAIKFVSKAIELSQANDNKKFLEFLLLCASYANSYVINEKKRLANCHEISEITQSHFTRGVTEFARGDYLSASQSFEKFHTSADKESLRFYQTGAMSVQNSDYQLLEASPPSIEVIARSKNPALPVFLVSCDTGYLAAYGPDFISKADKLGASVHFHVINPMIDVVTKLVPSHCGLSTELVSDGDLKTYTAISRYVVAEQILDIYGSIVVCDIDLDIKTHPSLLKDKADGKIGLILSQPQNSYFPWTAVIANHALFSETADSRVFLHRLRLYLQNHYDSGRDGWMLDQTALEWVVRTSDLGIFNLLGLPDYPLSQISERAARRAIARKYPLRPAC